MKNTASIVIPTRNEEASIKSLIISIVRANIPCQYEIIVVDDSTDNTAEEARKIGCRVIDGQRKGLGQAIIDGIKASQGDIVVVMDADGSHPTIKIRELVKACNNGYDMAIGSRYVKDGGFVGCKPHRKLISRVAGSMAYPIARVLDGTSGFFAFRKNILDGAVLQADSWKIMLEVLVKAKPQRFIEIPIQFKDRELGESKFNRREVAAYLKHLFKLALWKWRILNFMIVGGIGYIVNVGIYYPLTLWFEETVTFFGQEFYLPPFIISSYIAMTSNYLMNKMSTFKGYQEMKYGYFKYLTTCAILIPVEMIIIWLFVRFLGMMPVVAVALVILIVFLARYGIVNQIIWRKKQS